MCVEHLYPLSLMKDLLATLATGRIFTKLDARSLLPGVYPTRGRMEDNVQLSPGELPIPGHAVWVARAPRCVYAVDQ